MEDYIPNTTTLASIWTRIGSFIIDFVIFWAVATVFGILFETPAETGIGFHLTGLPAFIVIVIGVFLWPISEAVSGKTIGKRLTRIKVISVENKPISAGQAFGRFFLGFIDYFFLIGIIVAITSKRNQRIGDYVANTIVVNKK